jgi:signal transduction histidine kinase
MTIAMMDSRPLKDTLTKSGATPIVIKDLKVAMRELSGGKYDALICFSYQTNYLLEHLGIDNLESEDLPLMPREYCYVSNNKELIEAINQELIKMEEEGVVDEVYVNVKTYFRGFKIPMWVWFILAALVIVSLTVVIIQQRISKRRLQKEIARARKSEELKGIFLSNVSHALRTPLNAIIGFSGVMLDGENAISKGEQKHLLELINDNGLQLLHLINELLSLSDIEGKKMLFDRQVTDVDYEMGQYAAEIRPQLAKGVSLVVEEPIGGMRALLDPKLLRMITMHFLDNALHHTTEGQITLSYYVKEGGFYVEVKDTGSGLPEDLKENIFGLLSEKNTYLQDETPGLGLTICKAIVERSGGKIGAADNKKDGHGTIIWFWVPVEIIL